MYVTSDVAHSQLLLEENRHRREEQGIREMKNIHLRVIWTESHIKERKMETKRGRDEQEWRRQENLKRADQEHTNQTMKDPVEGNVMTLVGCEPAWKIKEKKDMRM